MVGLGKLPRPRKSPALTLGDCVIKGRGGRRRYTLAEALSSSPSPTNLQTDQQSRFQIQNDYDPVSTLQSRSDIIVGTGGPSVEAQRGPCVQIGRGRCMCRGGKLADRFLFANCDLAAINKKNASRHSLHVSSFVCAGCECRHGDSRRGWRR